MYISIKKSYRQKGLATTLFKYVVGKIKMLEPAVKEFLIPVVLDSGKAFMNKLGGTLSLETAENRLYLNNVDWDMINSWIKYGELKNPDINIKIVTTILEEDIQEYSRTFTEILNQSPRGDLNIKINVTSEIIRQDEERFFKAGRIGTTMYSKETDGKISGLTEIYYLKEVGYKIDQGNTGVKQEYRGRGLGKLLKAKMLLYIRENYPEVKYVITENADSNAAMLAINTKIGFKRHMSISFYKHKINNLNL